MSNKITFKEFTERAKGIHGDKYLYVEDSYVCANKRMEIICPEHGSFLMTPSAHTNSKQKCKKCYLKDTIERNKIKHAENIRERSVGFYEIIDWLDFSNQRDWVLSKCQSHGSYKTKVSSMLFTDYFGCIKCKRLKEAELFIDKATILHKDKYTYLKDDYVCSRKLMNIKCNNHNLIFKQRPSAHLQGQGCPSCGAENASNNSKLGLEAFVERAKAVHNGIYDYSQATYIDAHTSLDVICPKHGIFKVNPNNHVRTGLGCKYCSKEEKVEYYSKEFKDKVSKVPEYHHLNFEKAVYLNNRTSVDVYCKLHEEWFKCTPNRLLDSIRITGCKTCGKIALNRWTIENLLKIPNIKESYGVFYYGEISLINGTKIGITKNLNSRVGCYRSDMKHNESLAFEVKGYKETTYFKAAIIETVLKKVLKRHHIKHNYHFGGKHEIFDNTCLSIVSDMVNSVYDKELEHLNQVVTHNNHPEVIKFVTYLQKRYEI